MPSTDEDADLIRRIARGDRGALSALALRDEGALIGLATGLLGGRSDVARDAVQDAWVKVIRHAGGFRGQSSVKTWLYRIVINRCKDLRQARTTLSLAGASDEFDPADATPDAGRASVEGERRRELHDALSALPGDRRLIVLLCYHQGLTHEQAAEVLDIPIGTLKSRLNAGLTELRARLTREVRA